MEKTFTDDELKTMLEAVYMAGCVAELNPESKELDSANLRKLAELEEKLLAMAGEFGAEDYANLDVASGEWFPSRLLEEESFASRCLKAQEDYVYWDRLVADLTDRDLHESGGFARWDEMSLDERDELLREAEEKYWNSFEREGIRHLRLATEQHGGGNN